MLPLFKPYVSPGVLEALRTTLYSGYIGQGPRCEELEEKLTPVSTLMILNVAVGTLPITGPPGGCRLERAKLTVRLDVTEKSRNTEMPTDWMTSPGGKNRFVATGR